MAHTQQSLQALDPAALRSLARSLKVNPAGKQNADLIREILKTSGTGNSAADPNGAARVAAAAPRPVAAPAAPATTAPRTAPVARPAAPIPVTAKAPASAPVAAKMAPAPVQAKATPAPAPAATPAPSTGAGSLAAVMASIAALTVRVEALEKAQEKPAPVPVKSKADQERDQLVLDIRASMKGLSADTVKNAEAWLKQPNLSIQDLRVFLSGIPALRDAEKPTPAPVAARTAKAAPTPEPAPQEEESRDLTHELLDTLDMATMTGIANDSGIPCEGMDEETLRETMRAMLPPREEPAPQEGDVGAGLSEESPMDEIEAARVALIGDAARVENPQPGDKVRVCAPEDSGLGNQVFTATVESIGPYEFNGQSFSEGFAHIALDEADGSVSDADVPFGHLYVAEAPAPAGRVPRAQRPAPQARN